MRTTLTILATAVGLVACIPAVTLAQKNTYGPPTGAFTGGIDTTGLGLTPDQQAKWVKVRDELQAKNAPLREQARQAMGGKSMRDLTPEERDKLRPKVQPIMDQM